MTALLHAFSPTQIWFAPVFLLAEAIVLLPTLPLLVELLVLALAALFPDRRTGQVPSRRAYATRLIVVVPAHNEEKLIATCVRSLIRSRDESGNGPANVCVTVIAHNCSDRTAQFAREAGADVLVLNDSVGGKGIALDFGLRRAVESGADATLIVDADSTVSPNLIPSVLQRFANGAAALQCRYEVANPEVNTRTRLAALAFRGINVLRPLGRSRLGLSCGIFGNGFGLSAKTIANVPYVANSIVEDLEYHLHLIRAGVRVDFVNDAQVLGEMPTASAAAQTQRARWEGGRILMRRRWAGPLLKEILSGHPRMLEPLLDLLALPLASVVMRLVAGAIIAVASLPLTPVVLTAVAPFLLAALATLLLYVVVAAMLGPDPGTTMLALASVPGYLFWKIALIPRTRLAARSNAAWVRTARNAEAQAQTGTASPRARMKSPPETTSSSESAS